VLIVTYVFVEHLENQNLHRRENNLKGFNL